MAEEPPIIIVDNRKIAPLYRVTPNRDASDDGCAASRPPFGVVDRVTLSREAKEKSLQFKDSYGGDFKVTADSAKRLPALYGRLLSDASKSPR